MLFYRNSGKGAPLILLHGLLGASENLGALARLLQQDFNVFSIDLPNHGRSDHAEGMDFRAMAEAVANWMDEQGLASARVAGHSLGGKVAMELALGQPEKVEKLVVLDIAPVAYGPRHERIFAGLRAVDPATVDSRSQADERMKPFVKDPAVRGFLLTNLVRLDGAFRWRMNLSDLQSQYSRLLEANREGHYHGDTLFLKGGNSDYISDTYKEEILRRFGQARVEVVSGTGHWLHAEKPERVARSIKNFLTQDNRGQNA